MWKSCASPHSDSLSITVQKMWSQTCMSSLPPIEGQFTPFLNDVGAQIRDKLQRQPLNFWADWGEQQVTRSPEQLIHETVAAQRRLCLPHTAPSINKPSARGDETIWTWTSQENIPFSLNIPTHADMSVFFSPLSSAKPSHMIGSDWLFSCTMMRDKEGGLSCVWKVNVSFGLRRAHTV